ncbi:uncharacterized protein LOC105687687 [Athalia rosae]|uniref:uncharacterized protein LOC105687687 n=1 Tax=Athalia rosae TaxID=37344 RepID=UPI002033C2C3|nr:uncharacterized protein LOC105687687 [Athalia rosae]
MSKIYIAEFFVDKLHLADQIIRDAGDNLEFLIRADVADFPTLEIKRQNLTSAKSDRPKNSSRSEFKAGQAVHFTLTPEKFVEKLQKHIILSIKIFRRGDSIPVCLAELPLSGCLCDKAQLKPFVFGGAIGLVDVGGNPSGEISVTLRITCYGRFVLTSYLLDEACFLFKNDPDGAEFRVSNLSADSPPNEEPRVAGRCDLEKDDANKVSPEMKDVLTGLPWEDFMRDIGGISPGAVKLSAGKPPPKQRRAPPSPAAVADHAVAPSETLKKKKMSKAKMKKKKKK